MSTKTVYTNWTQEDDMIENQRRVKHTVEVPAEGVLYSVTEAMLSLRASQTYIDLPGRFKDFPDNEVIAAAIRKAAKEQQSEHQGKVLEALRLMNAAVLTGGYDDLLGSGNYIRGWTTVENEAFGRLLEPAKYTINTVIQRRKQAKYAEDQEQKAVHQAKVRVRKEIEHRHAAVAEQRAASREQQIAQWAETQGSVRLKLQVRQGHDGWPLYLHERLAHEMGPEARLESEAGDWDLVANPTEAQLVKELEVVGYYCGTTFDDTSIRFVPDNEDDGFYYDHPASRDVAIVLRWRPGDSAFDCYTVAVSTK